MNNEEYWIVSASFQAESGTRYEYAEYLLKICLTREEATNYALSELVIEQLNSILEEYSDDYKESEMYVCAHVNKFVDGNPIVIGDGSTYY